MGWTETDAIYYKYDKKHEHRIIDRKAECDELWDKKCKVLMSAMVGRVYYAALLEPNGEVSAHVVVTSTRNNKTIAYKAMSEDVHPYYYDCPKKILDLLTPTTNKSAQEWRDKCYESIDLKNKKRADQTTLSNLPYGAEIIVERIDGSKISCVKMKPNRQFKTTWYKVKGDNKYISKRHIKNYEII